MRPLVRCRDRRCGVLPLSCGEGPGEHFVSAATRMFSRSCCGLAGRAISREGQGRLHRLPQAAHIEDAEDITQAAIPTPETCASCHSKRYDQFKKGKHALAWAAMKAMPTLHAQPMAMIERAEGWAECIRSASSPLKISKELKEKSDGFGITACDSCHSRICSPKSRRSSRQACRPAIWGLTIRSGRCRCW